MKGGRRTWWVPTHTPRHLIPMDWSRAVRDVLYFLIFASFMGLLWLWRIAPEEPEPSFIQKPGLAFQKELEELSNKHTELEDRHATLAKDNAQLAEKNGALKESNQRLIQQVEELRKAVDQDKQKVLDEANQRSAQQLEELRSLLQQEKAKELEEANKRFAQQLKEQQQSKQQDQQTPQRNLQDCESQGDGTTDPYILQKRKEWQDSFKDRLLLITQTKERRAVQQAPNSKRFETKRKDAGRSFVSQAIDETIAEYKQKIKDPEIAWLFENCFPNTVDTTVKHSTILVDNNPELDSFVITGDIDAMWLRDSTNQVWPYLPLASKDPKLKDMLAGLLNRQVRSVLLDPYANAFLPDVNRKSHWSRDQTQMKNGIHERKYELDSLASVVRLSVGYYEATSDTSVFNSRWISAMETIIDHMKLNQRTGASYSFKRSSTEPTETLQHGVGRPGLPCGMSQSPFRPSDDASTFPYPVAANGMAVIFIRKMISHGLLDSNPPLKERAINLANEMDEGIKRWGIINHQIYGKIYAFEVDGRGSAELMDDANVPSLLSLPYLGYVSHDDETYQRTRHFLLSTENPWFFNGSAAEGIGGPHGHGPEYIWPMSIIMRALTSTDDNEIELCLGMLKSTHGGTGFMHESFHKDTPSRFTRHWFAWANTLFGELIMKLANERPHLIFA